MAVSGHVVNIQAWAIRRMISMYNYLLRRPHVPRERPLRRLMRSQGIDVELDPTPRTSSSSSRNEEPEGDDEGDDEGDEDEEEEEEEEDVEDEDEGI